MGHSPGAVGRHVVSKRHRVGHCDGANAESLVGRVSDYLKSIPLRMLRVMIFTTLAQFSLPAAQQVSRAQGSVLRGWSLV